MEDHDAVEELPTPESADELQEDAEAAAVPAAPEPADPKQADDPEDPTDQVPIQTDNRERPEDPAQDVSQDPDYVDPEAVTDGD